MKIGVLIFFTTLCIFSVAAAQDSLNIVKLSTLPMTAFQVEVQGDYAYVAAGDSGLRVIDVSDPTDPHVVGSYSWGGDQGRLYNPAHFAVNGRLVFSGMQEIIDFTDPANPTRVGQFPGNGVIATDGSLFINGYMGGFDIYDLNDPTNLSRISRVTGEFDVLHLVIRDTIMIVSTYGGFPEIYNVGDPAEPIRAGILGLLGEDHDLDIEFALKDSLIVDAGGLKVANLNNPGARDPLGYYNQRQIYNGVAWGENGLILAVDQSSLNIFRFTPPEDAAPQLNTLPPDEFTLYPAFPNPFNSSTRLDYYLPQAGWVSLKLFDLSGREVFTGMDRIDRMESAGRHSITWNAGSAPAGVYFVRMTGSNGIQTCTFNLIK